MFHVCLLFVSGLFYCDSLQTAPGPTAAAVTHCGSGGPTSPGFGDSYSPHGGEDEGAGARRRTEASGGGAPPGARGCRQDALVPAPGAHGGNSARKREKTKNATATSTSQSQHPTVHRHRAARAPTPRHTLWRARGWWVHAAGLEQVLFRCKRCALCGRLCLRRGRGGCGRRGVRNPSRASRSTGLPLSE